MNTKLFELLKKELTSKKVDTNQSFIQLVKIHRKLFFVKKIKLFPYPTTTEANRYLREYFKHKKITEKNKTKNKPKKIKVNYYEYIKSEKWKELTVKFKIFKGERCEKCLSKQHLQTHHIHYKTLGNENFSDLMLLCGNCHKKEHGIGTSEKDIMKFIKNTI
jgi:5-methylcytosine-specific restriction endonuclease McrA